jgi:hypothetical protein
MKMEREKDAELEADIVADMNDFAALKQKLLKRYGYSDRFEHFFARLVARYFGPPEEISDSYSVYIDRTDNGDYRAEIRVDGYGSIYIIDAGKRIMVGSSFTARH